MLDVIYDRQMFHHATVIIIVRRQCSREAAVDFLIDEAVRSRCDLTSAARRVVESLSRRSAD